MYPPSSARRPILARASVLGSKEPPNQDHCSAWCGHGGAFGAAVADGVGSLADSHLFSKAAVDGVEAALQIVTSRVEGEQISRTQSPTVQPVGFVPGIDATPLDAVADGSASVIELPDFSRQQRANEPPAPIATPGTVRNLALENTYVHDTVRSCVYEEIRKLGAYTGATTLLYVLGVGDRIYWGRVGDGALFAVFSDGRAPMVSEMPGKVYTTTDVVDIDDPEGLAWESNSLQRKQLDYVTLMTDGISDALEDDPWTFLNYLNNQLKPLAEAEANRRMEEIVRAFPVVHGDDKTMIYINFSVDQITESGASGEGELPDGQDD